MYDVLGLVAALRVKGQMPTLLVPVGLADGLGGRAPPRVSERRAERAADEVCAYAVEGLSGGLVLCIYNELGREGAARGMMSRGSGED